MPWSAGSRVNNLGSIVATYTFNGLGQRTYQGPTTSKFQTAFAYTGTGRLASYATSAGVSASYTYDAAGQRIGSVVTSSGVTTTSKYTYEGLSLLSLEATAASTPYTVNYLYDASGRAYAGTYKTAAGTTVFRLVTTDRGDVVELLDVNGARFASYRYDEWGLPTATVIAGTTPVPTALATEISTRQVLRYAGYCYDQHSGMYYLSARTYDPTTRQFLSKDPAKADGEESAYQYCGGDPVGKVDPTGEWRADLHYDVTKQIGMEFFTEGNAKTMAQEDVDVDTKFPGDWSHPLNWPYHYRWSAPTADEWSRYYLNKALACKHAGNKTRSAFQFLGRALHAKQDAIGHARKPDGYGGWVRCDKNMVQHDHIDHWEDAGSFKDSVRGASRIVMRSFING